MAIALDSNSRGNNSANHTVLSFTQTCTGSNLVLYVLTSVESDTAPNTAQTVSSITYNSVSLTNLTSKYITGNTDNGVEIWRLINPSTGANTVTVTWTGQVDGSFAAAVSFTGVDQTTPEDATPGVGETTPAGASVSATVTTATANAYLLNIIHSTNTATALTKDTNDTQLYNEITTGDHASGVSYRDAGSAGSKTSTWTVSPDDRLAMAMVAIRPASSSTSVKDLIGGGFLPFPR